MASSTLVANAWRELHKRVDERDFRKTAAKLCWIDADIHNPEMAARTLDLANNLELPVALAALPARITVDEWHSSLSDNNLWREHKVVQFGWNATNHESGPPFPPSEFGARRNVQAGTDEIVHGKTILQECFGDRFVPVFIPTFLQISAPFVLQLKSLGFKGLCTSRAIPAPADQQIVAQANSVWAPQFERRRLDDHQAILTLSARMNTLRAGQSLVIITNANASSAQWKTWFSGFASLTRNSDNIQWQSVDSLFDA